MLADSRGGGGKTKDETGKGGSGGVGRRKSSGEEGCEERLSAQRRNEDGENGNGTEVEKKKDVGVGGENNRRG